MVLFKCQGITGDTDGRWAWTRQCQSEKRFSPPLLGGWKHWEFSEQENLDDEDNNQQDKQHPDILHWQRSYILKCFHYTEVCWNSLNLGWNVQPVIHIVLSNALTLISRKAWKGFCHQPCKGGGFPEVLPQACRGHWTGTWLFHVLDTDEEIHSSVGFWYNMHMASWVGSHVVSCSNLWVSNPQCLPASQTPGANTSVFSCRKWVLSLRPWKQKRIHFLALLLMCGWKGRTLSVLEIFS